MSERRWGRAGRVAVGVLLTALVVLPALLPNAGAPSGTDGPLHALAGALLASAYAILLGRQTTEKGRALVGSALIMAVTVGVGVELGQTWIPGRQPSLHDALAHAGGAVVGVAVGGVWTRRRSS